MVAPAAVALGPQTDARPAAPATESAPAAAAPSRAGPEPMYIGVPMVTVSAAEAAPAAPSVTAPFPAAVAAAAAAAAAPAEVPAAVTSASKAAAWPSVAEAKPAVPSAPQAEGQPASAAKDRPVAGPAQHKLAAQPRPVVSAPPPADDDSDDDLPLAQRRLSNVAPSSANIAPKKNSAPKQNGAPKRKLENGAAKAAKAARTSTQADAKQRRRARADAIAEASSDEDDKDSSEEEAPVRPKRKREAAPKPKRSREPLARTARSESEAKEVKWTTLEHAGVLFPPEYEPHGIKMLYEGQPVDLTPEQEEVATFFAVMKETDYMNKPVFLKNFWAGFQEVLGKKHKIKSLENCDFKPIYEHHMAEREKQKQRSKEEKEQIKAERDVKEAKFKIAKVDGKVEQVGNFRVEPPGLFRGRGEHPKMGRIKRRIYAKDVTLNIGRGVPVPEHPFPNQHWKEIRHDNTVTWLAFWHDPVSPSSFKYVWLAANSGFKSDSDMAKYEKARKLKQYIGPIRKKYEEDWQSKDVRVRQSATALYFIDILALRAGHEKDEEEADTVGCCNLKAENVHILEDELKPNTIEFDFLGKDSIQYQKEVKVRPQVYNNVKRFISTTCRGKNKQPSEQLFDAIDATDLNKTLKDAMEGLSAKVFRTYNASVTLDRLLWEQGESPTVDARKADYDRANKEVAILCNHQRAVGKAHDSQMEKMQAKLDEHRQELALLQANLKLANAEEPSKDKDGKAGKVQDPAAVKARIQKKEEAIHKQEISAKVKEDLKTVALGTSKINYLDPRISVSWCKRHEVPMEKVFNKSLLSKFFWAMDCDPDFRF